MKVAIYTRVSTGGQNPELHFTAWIGVGCVDSLPWDDERDLALGQQAADANEVR